MINQEATTFRNSNILAAYSSNMPPSIFFSCDNGGYPFCVTADTGSVKISKDPLWRNSRTPEDYNVLVAEYDGATVVPGIAQEEEFNNCTILIQTASNSCRYVYAGELVYEFTAPEPMRTYYTYMGNSEVPYPVAVSESFAYFMMDQTVARKSIFPVDTEWMRAYNAFYDLAEDQSQPMSDVRIVHGNPNDDLPVRPAEPAKPAS